MCAPLLLVLLLSPDNKPEDAALPALFCRQTVQIYYLCKQHGWVLPSVYQGLYNPLARQVEVELLPALRTLGIAFYVRPSIRAGFPHPVGPAVRAASGL